MKRFLLCLTALLFLLPAIVFSEENPNPEMELGGNLFLVAGTCCMSVFLLELVL